MASRKVNGGNERTAERTERDRAAAQLREDGFGWLVIAERLGYSSPGHAYTAVQKLLDRIPVEAVEALRKSENARLNAARVDALAVLRRRHVAVSNGQLVYEDKDGRSRPVEDDAPALKALEVIVRISERMAKLNGLDAAQQVELSGAVNWTLVGVDPEALT